jgi:hypothetical protein
VITRTTFPTRLAIGGAVAAALLVPLIAAAASRGNGNRTPSAAPSFQRDVAPILRAKCTGCHQTGGIAPFPLETAKQAHAKAPLIAAAVGGGIMPPWPPGPSSPDFVGERERTLTAAQRSTIVRWARAGGRASGPGAGKRPPAKPDLRPGERRLRVEMTEPYSPRGQNGATDDYRCFLLDPKLASDVFATSVHVVPGASAEVHHVILFRADPAARGEAQALDDADAGPGWSCFGGIGFSARGGAGMSGTGPSLDDASWISAWAPGWGAGRLPDNVGVLLQKGSLIVMQVHYNLLNGRARDRSRAVLTVAPSSPEIEAAETSLLPAPVELACVAGERGKLCSRDAALADLGRKYGSFAAFVPAGLLTLCGQDAANPKPSTRSVCDRLITRAGTIQVVAGHMHLLGKSIRLELNPGHPDSRILLDISDWDFHWQNMYVLAQPVDVKPGDVVRVTCRYDPARRRSLQGVPKTPRYVLWGEGTTDEMCLGILQMTRQ